MIDDQGLFLLRHALVVLTQRRPSRSARRSLAADILRYFDDQTPPLPFGMRCFDEVPSRIRRAPGIGRQTPTKQSVHRADAVTSVGDAPTFPRRCSLSPATALVLRLSASFGLDGAGIAFLLGMSRSAARRHLRDAIQTVACEQESLVSPASRRGTDP